MEWQHVSVIWHSLGCKQCARISLAVENIQPHSKNNSKRLTCRLESEVTLALRQIILLRLGSLFFNLFSSLAAFCQTAMRALQVEIEKFQSLVLIFTFRWLSPFAHNSLEPGTGVSSDRLATLRRKGMAFATLTVRALCVTLRAKSKYRNETETQKNDCVKKNWM